jgi:hypothetical protein
LQPKTAIAEVIDNHIRLILTKFWAKFQQVSRSARDDDLDDKKGKVGAKSEDAKGHSAADQQPIEKHLFIFSIDFLTLEIFGTYFIDAEAPHNNDDGADNYGIDIELIE